jgi:4-diphosphocytidyl-2-C-methyl-D-erythritol kinase
MMNNITNWPCPAKLNLFLHIVGQREDGYHNLQSVFQLLDYADQLCIEITDTDNIEFDCDQKVLASNDNLVVKAAQKLQLYAENELSKKNLGAKILLKKKLPIGGGVGGGSSNCATTLVALNYLWKLGLPLEKLAEIGISLGADVPIFIMGDSAFVEGIGEILTPLKVPEAWYLVIRPDCHVSTAKIFSNPLLTRDNKIIRIRDLDIRALPYQGKNCMQDVVTHEYPEVEKVINWAKKISPNARMTGSGSCVFLAFDNEREMGKIATQCEWPHFVAKGVNKSPLHIELLERDC